MASNTKSIYVDFDDVLCATARHFLAVVEREFDKRIAYDELTDFDIGTSCGLRPEETAELYRIVHRPDELMQMAPIDGAIAALRQWADSGYEIAIVTGRPPESYEPSLAWLNRYRMPHQSFSMVDKYSRFRTDNTVAIRLDELARREYCWAVEVSLPMAQFLATQMKLPVALIDCPWNRAAEDHVNVGRYAEWQTLATQMPRKEDRRIGRKERKVHKKG
jgi:uncharacterized HAD superfamily protein